MTVFENRKKKKPWWHDLAIYKKPKKTKDDMKYLLLLLYALNRNGGRQKRKRGTKRAYGYYQTHENGGPQSRLQRCIIKMSYATDKTKNVSFLKNYMRQADKDTVVDKPTLFSDDPITEEMLTAYVNTASDRFFRFIISPEKNGVPLDVLTKELVKKMETRLGRKFRWFAAVHTDTEHHHVHLLIDGTDKDGAPIERLPYKMVTQDVRRYAQEILTTQLGFRTKDEIRAQNEKLYTACRFTRLDKSLERHQNKLGILHDDKWLYTVRFASTEEKKRLETLAELGIAARHESLPDVYYLEKGWTQKLLAANNHNTFLRARKELRFTAPQNLELYTKGAEIHGVVTKIYNPNWEDTWKGAYIVENKKLGRAWYVPVPSNREPKQILGQTVTIRNRTNENGFTYPVIVKSNEHGERN